MSETNKEMGTKGMPVGRGRGRGPGGPVGPGGPGHGMPVEKAKDFKSGLKRLARYLTAHKVALILVTVTAVGSAVFSIFGPKILGQATTELFAPTAAKVEAFTELEQILPADVAEQIQSGEIAQDEIMTVIQQNVDMTDPDNVAALQQAYQKLQAANAQTIDFAKIGGILLTVIVLYLVSGLFTFVMQFVMAKTSQQVVYDMRRQVDEKLARLPLK